MFVALRIPKKMCGQEASAQEVIFANDPQVETWIGKLI